MKNAITENAFTILTQLEQALVEQSLWQSERPADKDLQSQVPFCVDTLRFEQWLQFILIERLTGMINTNQPLPVNFSIMPMAEEAFKPLGKCADKIISLINELDQLLNTEAK